MRFLILTTTLWVSFLSFISFFGYSTLVFINTGQEFDGSDSGARPDEAVSWGKIRIDATPVKIYADATLVFPLLVSQTFAKYGERLNHEEHEEEATA